MNLYKLTVEGAEINRILTENEGELTPELEARLDAILGEGKDKVEAAAMVVRGLEASEEACAQEVQRLTDRAKSFARQSDNLKARMLIAVDAALDGKVKTDKFTIWGQNSADTVQFEVAPDADLSKIDSSVVRTTYALDKIKLKAMVQGGEAIPAEVTAIDVPGKRSLRIK